MSNPSAVLFPAVVALLEADAGVIAAFGGLPVQVYRTAPEAAPYPFIELPGAQVLDNEADGFDGSETHLQVSAWSRPDPPGPEEAERLIVAAATALAGATLNLAGFTVVRILPTETRAAAPQRDGQTWLAVHMAEISADPV